MRNKATWLVATILCGLIGACEQAPPAASTDAVESGPSADTIIINGNILTVDNDFSTAEALAIDGARIVAVGDSETISELADDSTRVIDLAGKTVIPGLIDNHMHFIRAAQRWNLQARIDGINSRSEALAIIAEKAASMPPW